MKRILIILSLTSLFLSCERDVLFEGPSLETMLGPFELIQKFEVSNQNVDFYNGETTFFTAEFSKEVDWKVVVTGSESGAVKSITGRDISLFENNATWDGSTTSFPMFKQESCTAELYVSYNSESGDSTITVTDALIGTSQIVVNSVKVNEGLMLSDFETGPNTNWDLFTQGGSMLINSSANSPQGNSFYKMSGNCSWDWLIGMATIEAESYGSTTFDLSDNPNEVYFNVLLNYPQEVVNKPIVLFDFREDDNQDGIFVEGAEDAYSIEIKDLDPGWHLISIKYSDLQTLYNGEPVAADGNDVMEPHLIHTLRVLFLAPQGNGYSEAHMDYMIFTEGKPLNP